MNTHNLSDVANAGPHLTAFTAAGAPVTELATHTVAVEQPGAQPGGVSHTAAQGASEYVAMLFVFVLATFVGLDVIRRVSRLLHTPLMSLTNAISAIAVVGAIIVAGPKHPTPITFLALVAVFAAVTNIVSGFLITDRMLKMFKKREDKKP